MDSTAQEIAAGIAAGVTKGPQSMDTHLFKALLVAAMTLAGLFAASPVSADSYDAGQIAVIEDATGQILPLGMCSNFMYPNSLCLPPAGTAFYATHPDNYDILIFVTNKAIAASEKVGYPLQADVKGIGQDTVPWSYLHFGSAGRLLQGVSLGSLATMPDDPEGIFSEIPISGLEVIGHEIGHHWLAYANIDLNDGRGNLDIIRGHREEGTITHWSCWFNSDSVMYGGMLTDNGDGSFTDINGPRKYSQLDQYLMGLRSPEEVDPMYYVEAGGGLYGCPDWPLARGVAHTISGDRVDFTMADVTRALGARNPVTSPCHYKVGFVFVHSPGTPPSAEDLAKVERYRTALETWYAFATDNRGSLDTRLDGCGTGTLQCPGQPSPQCGVSVDGDDDTDLPQQCTPQATRCNNNRLERCNADGSAWTLAEDCLFGGGTCENDACVYADGDAAETADNPEEFSEYTMFCLPGELLCAGTNIQKCASDGGSWEFYVDCAPALCVEGACGSIDGDTDATDTVTGEKTGSSGGCSGGIPAWIAVILPALAALRRKR